MLTSFQGVSAFVVGGSKTKTVSSRSSGRDSSLLSHSAPALSEKTHTMADNQRHTRYERGSRRCGNASCGHDSRHVDRERSSRVVDFDLRSVSLQTQPLPGSAGQGTSFDPPPSSSFSAAPSMALEEPSEHDQAGVSSKKLELETTATAGKAVTRPTFKFVGSKNLLQQYVYRVCFKFKFKFTSSRTVLQLPCQTHCVLSWQ